MNVDVYGAIEITMASQVNVAWNWGGKLNWPAGPSDPATVTIRDAETGRTILAISPEAAGQLATELAAVYAECRAALDAL